MFVMKDEKKNLLKLLSYKIIKVGPDFKVINNGNRFDLCYECNNV